MIDRKHEIYMVALSLEESSMIIIIEDEERRDLLRCPEYYDTNEYWIKVNDLLKSQQELIVKIRKFDETIMDREVSSLQVYDFLMNHLQRNNLVRKRKVGEDHVIGQINISSSDGDDEVSSVHTSVSQPTTKVATKVSKK